MTTRYTILCLAILALGCNTFGDLNEAESTNQSNNTSNSNGSNNTNVSNNQTNASNNQTNASNNQTNASNNQTNASNNQTNGSNNQTNSVLGRPVDVNCTLPTQADGTYEVLKSDLGGFVATDCPMPSATRFSSGAREIRNGSINRVSMVADNTSFHGVWSAGAGYSGRIEYDTLSGETIAFSAGTQAPDFGTLDSATDEVVLFRTSAGLQIAQINSNPTDLIVDTTPFAMSGDVAADGVPYGAQGLGFAGGVNPFNNANRTPKLAISVADTGTSVLSTVFTINPMNITPSTNTSVTLALASPHFIESTSGRLLGYLTGESVFVVRDVESDKAPTGLDIHQPGSVALMHLAGEHYVVATIRNNTIQLQRYQFQPSQTALSLQNGPAISVVADGEVNYIELAAVPGGLVLFYDQTIDGARSWTILPIRVQTYSDQIETFSCQTALQYSYSDEITYNDVEIAAIVDNCDLTVGVLTSFVAEPQQFIHLEGAVFRSFYGRE